MTKSKVGQILEARPHLIDQEVLVELNHLKFWGNRANLRVVVNILGIAPADRQTQRQLTRLVLDIQEAIARHLTVRERGIAAGKTVRVHKGLNPTITTTIRSVDALGFVHLAHTRGAYNPLGITVIPNNPT